MIDFKRSSDNLVVAGNGPSIKNFDRSFLPNNFDVFRCNHFYKEDKYYLGKNVKLVSCSVSKLYSLVGMMHRLECNNDYDIEHVMLDGCVCGYNILPISPPPMNLAECICVMEMYSH